MRARTFIGLRHDRRVRALKRLVLFVRGIAFAGRRFVCPCCGWHVRAFVGAWGWRASENGYCPRCNAKARHRRLWLYLRPLLVPAPTNPRRSAADGGRRLTLLDVAPWPSLARCTRSLERLLCIGVDLRARGPHVSLIGDAVSLPLRAGRFDVVVCQHVLEHVGDDRRALGELFRVTKPGGQLLVSVPIRLDQPTREDPSIIDPEQRRRLFGERDHVRLYGWDLFTRLTAAGFQVELDDAHRLPASLRKRHGLRTDEHIFHCRRPMERAAGASTVAAQAAVSAAAARDLDEQAVCDD